MTKKERIAKIVRCITVPPVMITALLLILYFRRADTFHNTADLLMLILLLGIVPALAYPLQKLLPRYKSSGREGQRALAFLFSLLGYLSALIWSIRCRSGQAILLICLTYCISVILLTICNKVFHIRSSGHACSQTAPMIFLICFISWKTLLPCTLLAALVVWASLTLRRHTVTDLLSGAFVCILSFILSYLLITFL